MLRMYYAFKEAFSIIGDISISIVFTFVFSFVDDIWF